ncbi:nuclear ribonucleoprotein A1, A2 B1 homolog [Octopus vulgaris]|uniref:Nuclear ribonucleoprotein A1, A2 B1 homolog n=1 Tax=Octopus vulgaris TaxID=6645 RepID=A0AA36FKN0_OCTVU|nr:nuclear ribonucleoprotein A1, A2 B1 homolog [Octopus vulgaris]
MSRGRFRENDTEKFCKLFIGGLHYVTDEESLKKYFSQWGEVIDCIVMRDPNSKKSRGFGFITYKTAEQVDEAQKHRPHCIDSKEVETKRAMPRNEVESQPTVKKLFVGGIKEEMTEEDLRELFGPFGEVKTVDMVIDKNTQKKKGFCFVTFEDYDTVDKLVLTKFFESKGKKIEVKKALSREEMNKVRSGGGSGMGMGPGGAMGYGMGGGDLPMRGGGGGGIRGGRGGMPLGRGRMNNWGPQGGFCDDGYGGSDGYGGGGGWNQGGGGQFSGNGYGGSWGSGGGGGGNFGSNYGSDYGGGPMKRGGYSQRGAGPYGNFSGGGGNSGGGGYRR